MDAAPTINPKPASPRSSLAAMFMLCIVAVLLWLPFGFKTPGLIEEWDEVLLLRHGYQLYFLGDNSPISQDRIRPLMALPQALAYDISANTFFGLDVIAFLVVLVQGAVFYSLVKTFLPGHRSIALVAAILFMVYPGDNAQFAMRMEPIRASALFYLLALNFFIRYWRRRQPLILPLMWGCLAVGLMLYEVSFPLVAITPLVLLWFGANRQRRRLIFVSLLWYIVPFILGIRILRILRQPGAIYEMQVLDTYHASSLFSVQGIADSFASLQHAYIFQFVTGWQDAWKALGDNAQFTAMAIGVAIVSGGLCWLLLRQEEARPHVQLDVRRWLLLLVIGLIVITVGFAPYLISPAHRNETVRVFMLSLVGSALVVTIGAFLISRMLPLKNLLFTTIISILIALAMIHGLSQQQLFSSYSHAQQDVMAQALEQAPHIDQSATLVVIDETGRMRSEWFVGGASRSIFAYIYGDLRLSSVLCFDDSNPAFTDECVFEQDGLHVKSPTPPLPPKELVLPYSALVIFRYFDNPTLGVPDFELLNSIPAEGLDAKTVAQYTPQAFIDTTTPIDPTILQVFQCQPFDTCSGVKQAAFRVQPPASQINMQFNAPIDGTGWRPPEIGPGGIPFRWMIATVSTLNFPFKADHDALIVFRVINQITPDILKSLKLSVNGVPIDISSYTDADGATNFHAVIPTQVLAAQPGIIHLAFSVDEIQKPPGDPQALGLAFTSLRLEELP